MLSRTDRRVGFGFLGSLWPSVSRSQACGFQDPGSQFQPRTMGGSANSVEGSPARRRLARASKIGGNRALSRQDLAEEVPSCEHGRHQGTRERHRERLPKVDQRSVQRAGWKPFGCRSKPRKPLVHIKIGGKWMFIHPKMARHRLCPMAIWGTALGHSSSRSRAGAVFRLGDGRGAEHHLRVCDHRRAHVRPLKDARDGGGSGGSEGSEGLPKLGSSELFLSHLVLRALEGGPCTPKTKGLRFQCISCSVRMAVALLALPAGPAKPTRSAAGPGASPLSREW